MLRATRARTRLEKEAKENSEMAYSTKMCFRNFPNHWSDPSLSICGSSLEPLVDLGYCYKKELRELF